MPRIDLSSRPLTRNEISQVLHSIASPPPSVNSHLAVAALTATAQHMSTWCNPDDVVMPLFNLKS